MNLIHEKSYLNNNNNNTKFGNNYNWLIVFVYKRD